MQPSFRNFTFQLQRRLARAPATLVAPVVAGALLLTAGLMREQALDARANTHSQLLTLQGIGPPRTGKLADPTALSLPQFSPTHLADLLYAASTKFALPSGAVHYVMEEGGRLPYRRYRATFALSGPYLDQRKMIADVLSSASSIVLDSIVCQRSALIGSPLVCDVTISAYYAKRSHG